mgnify:CR=1 FL=1
MKPIFIVNPEEGTVDKVYKNIGTPPGKGYRHARINGTFKLIHRVVWEYVHGPIPEGMHIDHINGNKNDNCISNLRLVTPTENAQNRPSTKGIYWCKRTNKWVAQIGHQGKTINLGRYEKMTDAQTAYAQAASEYHTHNPKALKKNASGISRGAKESPMSALATAITSEASV